MAEDAPELELLTPFLKRQDYSKKPLPSGVELRDLRRFTDDGGSFQELFRLTAEGTIQNADGGSATVKVRQLSYSVMEPGAVKAWHLHRLQHDVWFVPPECKLIVGLWDLRVSSTSPLRLTLGDGKSQLLIIPPGVAHGAANPYRERAIIVYAVDRQFNINDPDEWRLPVGLEGTKDFWEVQKG